MAPYPSCTMQCGPLNLAYSSSCILAYSSEVHVCNALVSLKMMH